MINSTWMCVYRRIDMNDTYTEDLSKFGYIEKAEARDLINALNDKKTPKDFNLCGVKVAFNMMSGFVFLTNDEYEVVMIDDKGELYSFYSSPYEGREGCFEDLLSEYKDMHVEDQEWFRDIAKNIDRQNEIKTA